jgi:hypothetical protein
VTPPYNGRSRTTGRSTVWTPHLGVQTRPVVRAWFLAPRASTVRMRVGVFLVRARRTHVARADGSVGSWSDVRVAHI